MKKYVSYAVNFFIMLLGVGIQKMDYDVSGIVLVVLGAIGMVGTLIFQSFPKRRTGKQKILDEIEKSRTEAVRLHIEGMQFADEVALGYWIERVEVWRDSTYSKLKKFDPIVNPADASRFYTLGIFPVQFAEGTRIINEGHADKLRALIRRVEILEEIRDKLNK